MTQPSRERGMMLTPGEVFASDYRVVRTLAQGGMGTVYLVEQLSTGKARALKLMHARFLIDAKARERFAQEARIGAQIESEHVVDVIAAGVDIETDTPWLVMELLDGEDLAARIAREGVLDVPFAFAVVQQIGHALAAAHDKGIVHRDLKPENVFIAKSRTVGVPWTVKILDFGIARIVQEDVRQSGTAAIGSPLWMAPEQTDRLPLTPAADIWSLGLVVFSMLTGRSYWKSGNYEDIRLPPLFTEILVTPLVPASERARQLGGPALPFGFDDWFAMCVARDPAQRFAHARAALKALRPDFSFVAGAPMALVAGDRSPHTHDTLWDPKTVSDSLPEAAPAAPAFLLSSRPRAENAAAAHVSVEPWQELGPHTTQSGPPRRWIWTGVVLATITLLALGFVVVRRLNRNDTAIALPEPLPGGKPEQDAAALERARVAALRAMQVATEQGQSTAHSDAGVAHVEAMSQSTAAQSTSQSTTTAQSQRGALARRPTETPTSATRSPGEQGGSAQQSISERVPRAPNSWSGFLESRRVRFGARLRLGRETGLGVLTLTVRQRRDPNFPLAEGSEVIASVRGTFSSNTLVLHVPATADSDVQADTYVLADDGSGRYQGRGQSSANVLVLEP